MLRSSGPQNEGCRCARIVEHNANIATKIEILAISCGFEGWIQTSGLYGCARGQGPSVTHR